MPGQLAFWLISILFIPVFLVSQFVLTTGVRHGPDAAVGFFVAYFLTGLAVFAVVARRQRLRRESALRTLLLAAGIVLGGAVIGKATYDLLSKAENDAYLRRKAGVRMTAMDDRPHLSPSGRPVGFSVKLSLNSVEPHRFCPSVWFLAESRMSGSAVSRLPAQGQIHRRFPKSDLSDLSHCIQLDRNETREVEVTVVPDFYHEQRGCILTENYESGPKGSQRFHIEDKDRQLTAPYATKNQYDFTAFLANMELEGLRRCP